MIFSKISVDNDNIFDISIKTIFQHIKRHRHFKPSLKHLHEQDKLFAHMQIGQYTYGCSHCHETQV